MRLKSGHLELWFSVCTWIDVLAFYVNGALLDALSLDVRG